VPSEYVALSASRLSRRLDEPALRPDFAMQNGTATFDLLIENWFPITYVLNNLNRGLGLQDAYPFVLSPTVIDKLRFIHECIQSGRRSSASFQSC
jgi:hypothetical protein